MQQSIATQICNYNQGQIFTPASFRGILNRNNIDQTLLRLTRSGVIRKLHRGLYDKPIINKRFGVLPPDIDKATRTYINKLGYKLQVHPARAAHMLGLSDQVPSNYFYFTDGRNKIIAIGNAQVILKHASAKKMLGLGTKAGLVIQALYHFGYRYFDDAMDKNDIIAKIKALLILQDIQDLKNLVPKTPVWMQNVIKCITTE